MADASMKRARKVKDMAARLMVTSPSSNGCATVMGSERRVRTWFPSSTRSPKTFRIGRQASVWPRRHPRSWRRLMRTGCGTVIRNLLENAIKYSLPDSRAVEVSAAQNGEYVVIRVTDDGPGIPERDIPSLFE